MEISSEFHPTRTSFWWSLFFFVFFFGKTDYIISWLVWSFSYLNDKGPCFPVECNRFYWVHPEILATEERNVHTKWTNLENKGLISVDRNNKATLLLTIPRSIFKSSTKDLSCPIFEIVNQRTFLLHCTEGLRLNFMALELHKQLYSCTCNKRQGRNRRFLAWILT